MTPQEKGEPIQEEQTGTEEVFVCNICNNYNRTGARFCKVCGTRFQQTKTKRIKPDMPKETREIEKSYFEKYIVCPTCDNTTRYTAKFCSKCGFNLEAIKQYYKEEELKGQKKDIYFEHFSKLLDETRQIARDLMTSQYGLKLSKNVETMAVIINQIKTRSYEESKLNTEKLSLINAITKAVNQSLELESIMNNTLDKALLVTRADAGVMMLIDRESNKLVPMAFKGVSPVLIEEIQQTSLKLETGSHGRAYILGRTVKAHEGPSSPLTDALVLKGSLLSIVNVPLKSEREVVGIMSIGSSRPDAFSDDDMKLLDAIGDQIGVALKNARLYSLVKNQVLELEEKNTRLRELEEMKNSLTQMIVHDLKNPLTGITGYVDLLFLENEAYNEEQLMALNMISVSCKNLMRMILNLLDIGKMEEKELRLQKTEINIGEIITKISDEFKPLLDVDNKKIITLLETAPGFMADRDLLYRVIANLVSNGISHSPRNKNIKIMTCLNEEKTEIVFCIEDKGIGIPEEYQKKIFDKFFQADEKQKSMSSSRGLGLTFCKLAVEAHGGKIWVNSAPGKGSKFYFSMPL
ncbi:MAG: ATP-binding protein [Candidatus Eremiobacterota bacterium]